MLRKFFSILLMGLLIPINLNAMSLSSQDFNYAFKSDVKIEELSEFEMQSIEGEWLFFVPIISSALTYTATSMVAGNFSLAGLGWAAGSGLIGGGTYGAVGRLAAPHIGKSKYLFNLFGSGITGGLNFSNPFKRGYVTKQPIGKAKRFFFRR